MIGNSPAEVSDLYDQTLRVLDADDVVVVAGKGHEDYQIIGAQRVVKLYPPFLRDHFEFETGMLARLHGRLRVPTPQLLASGERDAVLEFVAELDGITVEEAERRLAAAGKEDS